jgi:hypothetical protein
VLGIGSLLLICGYGGLVMFAYYHDCDPVTTQQVSKKDQLFPLFVMQVMGDYPGIPGRLSGHSRSIVKSKLLRNLFFKIINEHRSSPAAGFRTVCGRCVQRCAQHRQGGFGDFHTVFNLVLFLFRTCFDALSRLFSTVVLCLETKRINYKKPPLKMVTVLVQ